jgi:hypothetical protein
MGLSVPTRQMAERLHMASRPGFDLVAFIGDFSVGGDAEAYAQAGATWCLDGPAIGRDDVRSLRQRIAAGTRR